MGGSKGRGKPSFERKAGRAGPVYRHIPILSETTGARDKRKFFKGLIVQPVQTGEDQIFNPFEVAARRGSSKGYLVRTSTSRGLKTAREGRRFNVVLPDGPERLCVF